MKMEHLVTAPHGGRVTKVAAEVGATLMQDEAILLSGAGRDRRP